MTAKKPIEEHLQDGRPRKFKSVEEMERKIDEYFKECAERVIKKPIGGILMEVISPAPLHIQGLCVKLDIGRTTLSEYEKLPEFSTTIKAAKRKCEAYTVDQLFEGQKGNKAEFVLQNGYGWSGKQDITSTTESTVIYIDSEEKKNYEDHINEVAKKNSE